MREIKFRLIKDGNIVGYECHGAMSDGQVVILHSPHDRWAELGPCNIVGHPDKYIPHDHKDRYTGFKDEKTKEIYQGDILNPGRREVHFGEYHTKVEQGVGFTTFSHDAKPPFDFPFSFATRQAEGSEVIANIHEKPTPRPE